MAPSPDPRSSLVSGRYIACLNEKEQHKLVIVVSLFGFAIQTVLTEHHQGWPQTPYQPEAPAMIAASRSRRRHSSPSLALGVIIAADGASRVGPLSSVSVGWCFARSVRILRRGFAFSWSVQMRVAWKWITKTWRATPRSPRNTLRTLRALPLLTI